MEKYYVLAVGSISAGKVQAKEGEIISTHIEKYVADKKANQLTRSNLFKNIEDGCVVILSNESLEKGKVYPEVLAKWRADKFDADAMWAMKSLINRNWRLSGNPISDDDIIYQLQKLKLTERELRSRFEERALKEFELQNAAMLEMAEGRAKRNATRVEIETSRSEMTYSFPAVRGVQAGKAFYVAQVPYSVLVRLFVFDEDESVPAQFRAQRILNNKRAMDIADYVLNNRDEYVLPALTASVSAEMHFEALPVSGASDRVGVLHISMDCTLLINDGQHRRKGIEYALKQRPDLAHETVAVTLYYDQGLKRSQQMFADINGKQVKPSSAINALYDNRNPYNRWILELLQKLPGVERLIDYENSSVGAKSIKIWSIVAFKKGISLLTGVTEKNISTINSTQLEELQAFAVRFFESCASHIPLWNDMIERKITAFDVREKLVIGHAVWLEALTLYARFALTMTGGQMVSPGEIIKPEQTSWEVLENLSKVAPEKESLMWRGRCVVLGRMQKTSDGVKSTTAKLLQLSNLTLAAEFREVEDRIRSIEGQII